VPQAQDHGHATQHLTKVGTYRLLASTRDGEFAAAWDYPGRSLLEVRIVRSVAGFARAAGEGEAQGQSEVYRDVTGSYRERPGGDRTWFYTVFAREGAGGWERWGEYELPAGGGPSER
jgi:hypothetical protein